MVIRIRWKELLISLALVYGVAGLSALLTMGSMETYGSLERPPLSPPGFVFPLVWAVLFTLMGVSAYLVYHKLEDKSRFPYWIYGAQLFFNFIWPLLFFNLGAYLPALVWLVVLWLLILAMILAFYRISRPAGLLQIPYLAWVAFAGYLNAGVWLLNG